MTFSSQAALAAGQCSNPAAQHTCLEGWSADEERSAVEQLSAVEELSAQELEQRLDTMYNQVKHSTRSKDKKTVPTK